jgi:hypothetical protein
MENRLIYNRTTWIKVIVFINGIAAILHLFFWITAFIKLPAITSTKNVADQINLATTYGFGIADFLWSVPLLLIGSIGLWKKTGIGWLAALLANSMLSDSISPGTILFLPFALVSFWISYFLWNSRSIFLNKENGMDK